MWVIMRDILLLKAKIITYCGIYNVYTCNICDRATIIIRYFNKLFSVIDRVNKSQRNKDDLSSDIYQLDIVGNCTIPNKIRIYIPFNSICNVYKYRS